MADGITVKSALLASTLTRARASHVDRHAVLSFPPFRLDLAEERLWKGTREVQLRPKPFAILRYLAQRPGRLITRSEIVNAVWGSPVSMSESLLRTHLHDLRHTLGEAIVETVIGRGYRFTATVSGGDDCSAGRRSGEGTDSIAVHAAEWARDRPLELLVAAAPGSVDPVLTRFTPSEAHARALKQVADALAELGLTAGVVFVVFGGARS
ncbi:MAG: winged helix-turn-helix domain-containing protein [Polyangiaceae bacterium]|jgi:DNA-binding winged helix-turn-helix (wHTH) protein